jgi:hypothetical protein
MCNPWSTGTSRRQSIILAHEQHGTLILSGMNAPVIRNSTMRIWVSSDPIVRLVAIAGPAILLVGALTWPLYLSSSSFAGSWSIHLWFMWKQSLTISAGHLPSLFFNYPSGVFYPQYAFYGGTLYALTGGISAGLGNAPIAAYVVTYLLAFTSAYGGWYWLARQAGLGRWQAQIPGLVFITSSYYLTLIYADGDWPEFVGVSMIPLMISAGLSILRADRLRMGPALALTVSCIFFFGSHSLTLVWGSTTITLVGLGIVICIPRAREEISARGLRRIAGLVMPAALCSAWFLVPAAAYEAGTWIATHYSEWRRVLRGSTSLVSMQHLFTLSRSTSAPPATTFALSLPVLVMAWALVGLALSLTVGVRGPWTRLLLICTGFTGLMTVLMTHPELILMLPRYYATMQFSYRLESYVLFGVSGAVLTLLVLAQRGIPRLRTWTYWALPPILVVAIIGAAQQTTAYPHAEDRNAIVASWNQIPTEAQASSFATASSPPKSSAGLLKDYIDVRQPTLNGSFEHPNGSLQHIAFIHFATTSTPGDRISADTHLRGGELADSNLFASPNFVHVTGARIIGINAGDGSDVLEISPGSSSTISRGTSATPGTISVASSASLPIVLGRALTLCAVIALMLQFGLLAIRGRKCAT